MLDCFYTKEFWESFYRDEWGEPFLDELSGGVLQENAVIPLECSSLGGFKKIVENLFGIYILRRGLKGKYCYPFGMFSLGGI